MVKSARNTNLAALMLSSIYFIGAAFISGSSLGDSFSLQVVYRIIYIPVFFWLLTLVYTYLFRAYAGYANIAMMLTLGLPLHIMLLLTSSYFTVMMKSADISRMYMFYIEAVLCALVGLLSFWGIKIVRRRYSSASLFFLPVLCSVPYAIFMAIQSKSQRVFCGLIAAISISILFNVSGKVSGISKNIYKKIAGFFKCRRNVLLAIFMFAFAARLAFGINIVYKTGPDFPLASDDGDTYDRHGCAMAKDASYIRDPAFAPTNWDIGCSFIMGFIYSIFGRSFYLVVLAQSLIGAFVPVLAYLLGDLVVKRRSVALMAAIWCVMDQPLIMMSSVIGQEAFYIPLLTLLIYLVARYASMIRDRINILGDILIGAVFGLAVVIRSAILCFLPILCFYLALVRNRSFLKRMSDIILILCIVAAIITPITYLNYLNSGKFYLLTLPKPILQWESDAGAGYFFPSNIELARIGVNPLKDARGSACAILRDPRKFLSISSDLLVRRYVGFFFCYNFGFFDPIYMLNAAKIPNRFASNLEFYISLAVFFGFLAVVADKKTRGRAWPMVLLVLYYVLMHVVVCRMGNARYRAPVHPYLIIFGAVGISNLVDYIKAGMDI